MIKNTFKWLGNILFAFLIIVSISTLFSIIQSKKEPGQTPSILGYKVLTVLSGSMEPLLKPGDIVIVKPIKIEQIKVNDVITYKNNQQTLVTHRITELVTINNEVFFQTKGDANNVEDEGLISSEQLVGMLAFHIPKIGYIVSLLNNQYVFFTIFSLLFLFLTIGIVRRLLQVNRRDKQDLKL